VDQERDRTKALRLICCGDEKFKLWSEREPYNREILEEKAITVALPHITFGHGLHLDLGGERIA
jgi:hypothetical protein